MSYYINRALRKLDRYCNQELYAFSEFPGAFVKQIWYKLIGNPACPIKDAPKLYWKEISEHIIPYIKDSSYTKNQIYPLIQLYFKSVKFSKTRNLYFIDSQKFYEYTIYIVKQIISSRFGSVDDKHFSEKEVAELKDFILNTCYYTDWFLYKMVEQLFYPDGTFTLDTAPKSYIKNIAFQIVKDYRFDNSPYSSDSINGKDDLDPSKIFIGRKSIIEKFLAFLQGHGGKKKGVYLVTGYRGMGKTSFVNRVIKEYRNKVSNKRFRVIPITISLAQRQPSEVDILHLMVSHLKDKLTEIPAKYRVNITRDQFAGFFQIALFVLIIGFSTVFIGNYIVESRKANNQEKNQIKEAEINSLKYRIKLPKDSIKDSKTLSYDVILEGAAHNNSSEVSIFTIPQDKDSLLLALISGIVCCAAILLCLRFMPSWLIDKTEEQINSLFDRCYASISKEKNDQAEFSFEQLGARINGSGNKETSTYPIASSKEIEYGLIKYLASIKERAEFIFIFDELDKIEPAAISTAYDSDINSSEQGAYLEQIRERKQAIINIIAGLKNFLTTAEARFIFIAGREMFDATLADVSDRQSSVGSIFNYVFYVQSFLRESIRDDVHSRGSMGQMIENYMTEMLITKQFKDRSLTFYQMIYNQFFEIDFKKLNELTEFLKTDPSKFKFIFEQIGRGICPQDIKSIQEEIEAELKLLSYQVMKAMITLQNLVNYLTYRSNGSPKKIIKTLHEFIRIKRFKKYDSGVMIMTDRTDFMPIDSPYVFLNFKDQYRIGFINHLFRPFIVKNGESFKKYSDNIIISTTYLFDHLLKFHPFAFSFANLELIPEVLSTNKTPSLRDHIITIIEYLSNNHLRETEIGIFDYKFYSRTVNELIYISKTFEEESAAFNFTLDEGFLVKLHVRNELRELRKVYSAFTKPQDSLNSAFSITHLNGILGDLHFFDQEYDDAIVAYSNAVNELRHESHRLSVTDFVVLIRFLLKLGLTFEKVKNYDEALAFYSEAAEESKTFIMRRINSSKLSNDASFDVQMRSSSGTKLEAKSSIGSGGNWSNQDKSNSSMFSDLLQIVNQAFIAKIVLQEKMGVEGITSVKFGLAIGGFLGLCNKVGEISGRNFMITANLYLVLGNLLYFKNSYRGFNLKTIEDNGEKDAFLNAYEPAELLKLDALRSNNKFLTPKEVPIGHTSDEGGDLKMSEKRMPVLSLWYYVIGLAEVIRSRLPEEDSLDFIFSQMSDEMKTFRMELINYHAAKDNIITLPEFNKEYTTDNNHNLIYDILSFLKKDSFKRSEAFSKGHYKYVAMFTSHIGDCLLSMVHVPHPQINGLRNYHLEEIFSKTEIANCSSKAEGQFDFGDFLEQSSADYKKPAITDVIRCYYQSALFFKKRGRMVSYSFQLRKILYTLRLVLKDMHDAGSEVDNSSDTINFRTECLKLLETWILNPILEVAGQTTDNTDRYMFSKFEGAIKKFNLSLNEKKRHAFILNNLSSHPDSREALTLFMYIKIKTLTFKSNTEYEIYDDFINPYDSYATQYTRMYELGFWAKLNLIKYKNAANYASDNPETKEKSKNAYAREYIFALFSQIHTVEIYGVDYMISHCFKAYIHYNIAKFLDDYGDIANKEIEDVKGHFGYTIEGSLTDKYYHYRMAISHYEKTRQLHKVGAEYIKNMDNIIYLEDDINDNAYHFGAALDRFLITNGTVDYFIKQCEDKIVGLAGNRYNLESYLGETF